MLGSVSSADLVMKNANVLFLLISLLSQPYGAADAVEHQPRKPNVLFLAVDDMKDWVNCLGGYEGTVYTPNIDRLAKRGMLFTNAHCASPKCAPSRGKQRGQRVDAVPHHELQS